MFLKLLWRAIVCLCWYSLPLAQCHIPAQQASISRSFNFNHSTLQQLPNIVVIISDDHHWSDYSFMGHEVVRTPHLDRLASQSAVFPNGYVPTSLCSPSLATILTGLYPHQHGITGNDPAIPPEIKNRNPRQDSKYLKLCDQMISRIDEVETVPGLLQQKGYASLQTGKWWLGSYHRGGFTHGMTHGDSSRGGRHGDEGLVVGRQGLKPIFDFIANQKSETRPNDSDPDNLDDTSDKSGGNKSTAKPFLIWYAPFLPHTPHNPPAKYLARYTAEQRPPELAKYYAMCEWFDDTCGQLLTYLDDQQLADDTIVIYLADNGWIQKTRDTPVPRGWTRGFAPRSKQSPYEGGVRTPLMIRWPHRVKPGIRQALASSIDIAPTILETVGIQPPAQMSGQNLISIAAGQGKARVVHGEIFAHDIADIQNPQQSLIYSWCNDGRWKLIKTHHGKMGRYASLHPQTTDLVELYDLSKDPHEDNNLARKHPQIVARLSDELNRRK